jgi:hypothetical protein
MTLVQKPATEPQPVAFPRFDPDGTGADPTAWCAAIEVLMVDHPLKDSALFSALNVALRGSASHWLSQVVRRGPLTWSAFKELFLARFGGQETPTEAVTRILSEPRAETESRGAFAIRIRSMIQTTLEGLTMTEVLNVFTLHALSSRDQGYRRLTLATRRRTNFGAK